MRMISEKIFKDLVAARASSLLQLSLYLSQDAAPTTILTRPLLSDLLSQSTQLEELLDAYGAQYNQQWFRFRAITAAIKLFANVSYLLFHIKHVLPSYHLLQIEYDFVAATNRSLAFTSDVLSAAAAGLREQGLKLGVPFSPDEHRQRDYTEKLPVGELPRNRARRKTDSASTTVTQVATAFLTLAAQSDSLHTAARTSPEGYAACFPDPISEERLRDLEKIVLHYGSEVHMELGGDTYDASSPLELFRANEKINAQKRRWLAAQILPVLSEQIDVDDLDVKTAVMSTVFKLAQQHKLIIYKQPLKLSEKLEKKDRRMLELVTSEIAQLQATEQIDMNIDLTTRFIGDKRVLADIELLAKFGYGEDRFGNNVALPKKLAYLRALST